MPEIQGRRIFDPAQGGRLYKEERGAPGESRMETAYTLSGTLLREKIADARPQRTALWERIKPPQLLVVDGQFDHIHLVLEAAQMAHERVYPDDLNPDLLAQARVVFVNCSGAFPADKARLLAPFVEAGGLVMTTDWAIQNVLEVAFPGFVKTGFKRSGNEFVAVTPRFLDDPVVEGFFNAKEYPGWWLENQSFPIARLYTGMARGLQVLVDSGELRRRLGHGSVIVRFPYGEGGVYHTISHLYLQQSMPAVMAPPQGIGLGAVPAQRPGDTVIFATEMGASAQTIGAYATAQERQPDMDYRTAHSAATSMAFVTGVVLQQLEKGTTVPPPAVNLDERAEATTEPDPKRGGGGRGSGNRKPQRWSPSGTSGPHEFSVGRRNAVSALGRRAAYWTKI